MGFIKPYKVIYTRIGAQESWSGWKVAGYTEGTTNDILYNCTKLQGKNSSKSKDMFDLYSKGVEEAREVYEFFCDFASSENNGFSFTKIKYGADDGGRTGMQSCSISTPYSSNEDILRHPEKLLLIDKKAFDDCKLDMDPILRASGKNTISLDEIQTKFELIEYAYSEDFDIVRCVEEYFGSDKIFCDLIKCVYWNLTFNSSSSIFIETQGDLYKDICVFLVLFNSILYSYRSKLSFRTFDFQDANNQPTIVFCKKIPNGVKYFDIKTGVNNILTDSILLKLKRESMEYYPKNFRNPSASNYFDLLEKTMEEFGSKNSTEISLLETAFTLVQAQMDSDVQQSDKDIKRKIITFCQLPYNNEKIDKSIAQLLDLVINGRIELNDDIRKYIDKKLSTTKCEELIEIGNQYRALSLLNEPKDKAFARLYSIKEDDKNFPKILEFILLETQGKSFIDEFYGEYYGPKYIDTQKKLLVFYKETKNIAYKYKINVFLQNTFIKLGKGIIDNFYSNNCSILEDMETFNQFLSATLSNNYSCIDTVKYTTREYFWECFELKKYNYVLKANYELMKCSDPRKYSGEILKKSSLVSKLNDIFTTVKKSNANTVRAFKNEIQDYKAEQSSKQEIIDIFKEHCLACCDKTANIDFWIALAELDEDTKFDFLFNSVDMFMDEDCFEEALLESNDLQKRYKLSTLSSELRSYYLNENKTKIVSKIYSLLSDYESVIRNKTRKRRKEELKGSKGKSDTDDVTVSTEKQESTGRFSSFRNKLFGKDNK